MKDIIIKNKQIFYMLLFYFLLLNISSALIECPRDSNINENCKINYCSEIQFSTLKDQTQCLNNIIVIGEKDYRYINFASFSNETMVVETTKIPKTRERKFFGITKEGRPFFRDEKLFYTMTINEDLGNYEAIGIIITFSSDKKDCFLSVSKLDCKTELIDFYNTFYSKAHNDFTSINTVTTLRNAFIPLSISSEYLMGFIGCDSYNNNNCQNGRVYFQKHRFTRISNFKSQATYVTKVSINNAFGKEVSCFQTTPKKLIICFFLTKTSGTVFFNFIKYDENLSAAKIRTISSTITDENLFNKCVYLNGEIGVFSSYKKYNNYYYPILFVMEFKDEQFKKYMSSDIVLSVNLNFDVLLNDIVNLTDNKIAFVATVEDKKTLYIFLINIYGKDIYAIRRYSIKIFELYHYKIMKEIRIHRYNNFLAFSSSFCTNEQCSEDSHTHYTGLIIFSYPNSVDYTLILEEYISSNNTIDIKNLEIDLKSQLILDNNIFGYILSNISIIKIDGPCPEYKSYSSKDDTIEINENYILENDENILFKYIGEYFIQIYRGWTTC